MNVIEQKFLEKKATPSDINEHLETLYQYAKKCETVAEFGVRLVVSSFALAHARPKKLICVDIETNSYVEAFKQMCAAENINMRFDLADTLTYELETVDMLFIDTLHSYTQLNKELDRHHQNINKYIILHDTVSYGHKNEDDGQIGENCGLVPAIRNFLQKHSEWKEICTYTNNNGLTILERKI